MKDHRTTVGQLYESSWRPRNAIMQQHERATHAVGLEVS